MSIFSKELKINNTFEVIFDNGTDQSSSKEEGDSLHNKVQAQRREGREENFGCSQNVELYLPVQDSDQQKSSASDVAECRCREF